MIGDPMAIETLMLSLSKNVETSCDPDGASTGVLAFRFFDILAFPVAIRDVGAEDILTTVALLEGLGIDGRPNIA